MTDRNPNRLIKEKSPYLLQHAYNPVDWYPWGEEAFEKARKEDKPVLLSIGYSTCHWCHVMERESFEDPNVARLMNETFVAIKVDREERPDLDHIYMTVSQILTGSGGWPLNVFMTPEKKPFFAATYIPKQTQFGRLGLTDLLPRLDEIWKTKREEVLKSADQILRALQTMETGVLGGELDEKVLHRAYQDLTRRYDRVYGGFSGAPKFPTPHNFLFLLRYWFRYGEKTALDMVEETLQALRQGGIYDHIGFGFHRYSTDKEWLVPHFEKMLYDQALLSSAYLEAFLSTGNRAHAGTVNEILRYVLRDMTSPEGAFYAGEDADSEGVEGKFYVWTKKEILDTLSPEEADLIVEIFNVRPGGNYREEAGGQTTGANILHLKKSMEEIASEMGLSVETLASRLASAREKLFEVRERRIHPHKDDKVLTDWNGLMIAALAQAGRILQNPEFLDAAKRCSAFILKNLTTARGRILHRYRDGEAGITGNLDDYAFLAHGFVELYQSTFELEYLQRALDLTHLTLVHFWDDTSGGFYFTPDDGESLLLRKKEIYDGALPSGNAVALQNLLRLSRLTADAALQERASSLVRAFSKQVGEVPSGYTHFLLSLDFAIGPTYVVVIAGKSGAEDTTAMLEALQGRFLPNHVVLFRPTDQREAEIDDITGFLKGHAGLDEKATAYVCTDNACKSPTTDIKEMLKLLG